MKVDLSGRIWVRRILFVLIIVVVVTAWQWLIG
ncbi:hypothetical protein J2X65_003535 [Ancylobacter sp. 3268]|nr:hypothetical protein [Ancylobacter sp. 3268]